MTRDGHAGHRARGGQPHRTGRAFSLVEMLVVVGIIVVLAGFVLAVMPIVTEQSQKRETRSLLTLVDQAVKEWELAADRGVSYGPAPQFDINSDTTQLEDLPNRLLQIVRRNTQTQNILRQIDPDLMSYDQGSDLYQLRDTWGNAVAVVFPGWPWDLTPTFAGPDEDGTVRTAFESQLGVAVARRIAFVSAGPDGKLGDLTEPADSDLRKQADDNLYSYPVLLEVQP